MVRFRERPSLQSRVCRQRCGRRRGDVQYLMLVGLGGEEKNTKENGIRDELPSSMNLGVNN